MGEPSGVKVDAEALTEQIEHDSFGPALFRGASRGGFTARHRPSPR